MPTWDSPTDDSDAEAYLADIDISCLKYEITFVSNNKLHNHLQSQNYNPVAQLQAADSVALFTNTNSYQIIKSTKPTSLTFGYTFQNTYYVSTLTSIQNMSRQLSICLDTGCLMTLIDADLVCSLDQEILTIDPVNIKGLDSHIKSSKYVNLDLYMLGYMGNTAAAGKLHLEAYLVPNLHTNVLIDVEVMDAEGFNIKFDNKVVEISSCQKLQCPITVHTKPHCSKESIPVYAIHTINVPSCSRVNLPVFIKKNLPTDCDFVFKPSNTFKKIA